MGLIKRFETLSYSKACQNSFCIYWVLIKRQTVASNLIVAARMGSYFFFLLDLPRVIRVSPRVFSNFPYSCWHSHLSLFLFLTWRPSFNWIKPWCASDSCFVHVIMKILKTLVNRNSSFNSFHLGLQRFPSVPKVLATVRHTSISRPLDAMNMWIEELQEDHFRVCLREVKTFDGKHQNIQVVSWSVTWVLIVCE